MQVKRRLAYLGFAAKSFSVVAGCGGVEHLAEISLNPVNPYHPISLRYTLELYFHWYHGMLNLQFLSSTKSKGDNVKQKEVEQCTFDATQQRMARNIGSFKVKVS